MVSAGTINQHQSDTKSPLFHLCEIGEDLGFLKTLGLSYIPKQFALNDVITSIFLIVVISCRFMSVGGDYWGIFLIFSGRSTAMPGKKR